MIRYLTIVAALSATSARAEVDPARGEAFVQDHCAACHAIGSDGDSPNLNAPPFRLLGRKYPVASLEEALAEGIFVGHGGMPEFELDPDLIGPVIAYLESIQN